MKRGRTKQSLVNITVSIIYRCISTLLPFAIRTIVIRTIGIEYLGVDSLFSSILSMLSLSELGFSAAVVFSMYKPVAEGNDEQVRALLTFYKRVYRIIGLVILGVGLSLIPFLEWFIPEGSTYPADINIRIVYVVLLTNTALSYLLFSYKSSILTATMRNDLSSAIEMVRSITSHGLQIVVLLLFRQYYLYILILPVVTIANNLVRNYIIEKRFPQYHGKATLSKKDRRDIFTRVGALIGNKIGGVIFTTADTVVISKFLGLEILAQYTNYFTVFLAVFSMESAVYGSFQSVVGNTLVCKSKEDSYALFKELNLVNAVLTGFCTCCFLTLYQPFISVWVGEENRLPYVIPLLLSVFFFVRSSRRICYVFKEATGMWREDFLKPYVSVIVNLTVNVILVQWIGLPGVVISSIAAILFVEIPWEAKVFFNRFFGMSPVHYFLSLLKYLLIGIGVAVACVLACQWLPEGIFGIALRLLVTAALCAAVYVPLVLRSPYVSTIKNRLAQILHRK